MEQTYVTVNLPAKPPFLNGIVGGDKQHFPRTDQENVFKKYLRSVKKRDHTEEEDQFEDHVKVVGRVDCAKWNNYEQLFGLFDHLQVTICRYAGHMGHNLESDKHDHKPKGDQRDKIVKLIGPVHAQAQANGEKVQAKHNLPEAIETDIARGPKVNEMAVTRQEQVHGHQHSREHVDGQHLRCSRIVIR